MLRPVTAALVVLLGFSSLAAAEMIKVGYIQISDQWVRASPKLAKAGAGYLTIKNAGSEDDTLISITANFPKVMIHGTQNDDGIMRMHHVDSLPIAAGETVLLEPGGFHVMFMGLDANGLKVGDSVEATLTFEKAGEIAISFPVRAAK